MIIDDTKQWVHHIFNINGESIKVATNGKTVNILSMNHNFASITLAEDRNYIPEADSLDGLRKVFEQNFFKNKKSIEDIDINKEFIDEEEMML